MLVDISLAAQIAACPGNARSRAPGPDRLPAHVRRVCDLDKAVRQEQPGQDAPGSLRTRHRLTDAHDNEAPDPCQ